MSCKCTALGFLGQHREQLESAKEWYCLWNTKPTDMGAIDAAFALIHSCMNNKEFADARLYASTLWGIINHKHDNKIPDNQRQQYIADGAYMLASATLNLAQAGGIPLDEIQKAGQEVIALSRRALELFIQLYGTESSKTANDMYVLADALAFFNDDLVDEVLRLFERSIAIDTRLFGNSSSNVGIGLHKLGAAYYNRAVDERIANDLNKCKANLENALPHLREAIRIYRLTNRVDMANEIVRRIHDIEEKLRNVTIAKAAALETRG